MLNREGHIATERIDSRTLLEGLVGETVYTIDDGRPNTVLALEGDHVVVGTRRSPGGQRIPISEVQAAADQLVAAGEIRIHPDALGTRRSSFIGAALAAHPGTVGLIKPQRVRLDSRVALRPVLEAVLAQVSEPRAGATATREDPFYRLLADEARDGVAGVVNDESSYKTQGSAGQGNWAETPWVAVFDLNVTDTAQRGYYIVYLFRRDGSEVFLSLNQGTTAVFRVVGAREYEAALQGRAASYARYVGEDALAGLQRGPIDLGGGRPPLTPGYQAGNIAATQYRAGAVPAESELRSDLQRFLSLYSGLVEVLDEVRAADDESIAADPVERTEAKRWAWHKRAEGRNRKAVQDAKRYHGYKCRACDIDFEGRYGQLGKRCIDAHHLEPFAELDDRPRRLNPITDFAIVCSNCHRMLHSRTPPLNVAELQDQLRGAN